MRYRIDANTLAKKVMENHKSFAASSRATGLSNAYISQLYYGDRVPGHINEETYQKLLSGLTKDQVLALERRDPKQDEAPLHDQLAMWIAATPESTQQALLAICKELGFGKAPNKKRKP